MGNNTLNPQQPNVSYYTTKVMLLFNISAVWKFANNKKKQAYPINDHRAMVDVYICSRRQVATIEFLCILKPELYESPSITYPKWVYGTRFSTLSTIQSEQVQFSITIVYESITVSAIRHQTW
jgi:hypothetical protein